jgi:hypothetical protein
MTKFIIQAINFKGHKIIGVGDTWQQAAIAVAASADRHIDAYEAVDAVTFFQQLHQLPLPDMGWRTESEFWNIRGDLIPCKKS